MNELNDRQKEAMKAMDSVFYSVDDRKSVMEKVFTDFSDLDFSELQVDESGNSFISRCAKTAELGVLRTLVVNGFDINKPDKYGDTVFNITCGGYSASRESIAEFYDGILELGSDPRIKNNNGRSPLFNANLEQTENILLNYPNLIDDADNGGWTPLIEAAKNGSVNKFNLLISSGADIDMENESGMTAIGYALMNNQVDILKIACSLYHSPTNLDVLKLCGHLGNVKDSTMYLFDYLEFKNSGNISEKLSSESKATMEGDKSITFDESILLTCLERFSSLPDSETFSVELSEIKSILMVDVADSDDTNVNASRPLKRPSF